MANGAQPPKEEKPAGVSVHVKTLSPQDERLSGTLVQGPVRIRIPQNRAQEDDHEHARGISYRVDDEADELVVDVAQGGLLRIVIEELEGEVPATVALEPGEAELVCPDCGGVGRWQGRVCTTCMGRGSGKVKHLEKRRGKPVTAPIEN